MSAPLSFEPTMTAPAPAGRPEGRAPLLSLDRLHLVSLTSVGRRPVLVGELAEEARRLVMELADHNGYRVVSCVLQPERLEVLVELSVLHRSESVTRELRGLTSLQLMQRFPALRVKLKANRLWE